jgi:hypothetical protein
MAGWHSMIAKKAQLSFFPDAGYSQAPPPLSNNLKSIQKCFAQIHDYCEVDYTRTFAAIFAMSFVCHHRW